MTKGTVEKIIRRYPYITNAINKELSQAEFYIGNRKHIIPITEEIKIICTVIQDVYLTEKNVFIKQMIKSILAGQLDIAIIGKMPYSKNSYYTKKQAFIEKVYRGCIQKGLVSYNEIMEEEIAI